MKTYDWMAGPKGNAHLCGRDGMADTPRPVCGVVIHDPKPRVAQSQCQQCARQEAVIKRYQQAMKERP